MQSTPGFSPSARHALLFHAAFGVLAVVVIALAPGTTGLHVLALVVLYNVSLWLVAMRLGYERWLRIWAFLLPLCVFQIVPDGFLNTVINSIVFPVRDGPMIGPIPLAMVGMWMVPLWLALFAGREASARGWSGTWTAALVAGLVLVAAEAIVGFFPFWSPVGVHTVGPVAVYVVIPEFLLGAAAYVAENRTRGEARMVRIIAAITVSVFYLGALGTSYYFFERIIP